jgi:hypothetical protein
VAFTNVFGRQLLEVTDLQFNLGPTFGGLDVLQTLQTGKEGSHFLSRIDLPGGAGELLS